jgi:signal transduction histidine kinase/DNA-binding response OmpR family regulator
MWAICNLMFLIFLLFFQEGTMAFSDSETRINHLPQNGLLLEKGWKYMPGDNPDWALPEWDDRHWQNIDPTLDIHDLPMLWKNNIGWLRIGFSIEDSTLRQESLALLVAQTGASEYYLNGRLIGKLGHISSQPEKVRAVSPPFGEFISFNPGVEQKQVLAVRFALQKNIPYIVFAGRPNRAVALSVIDARGISHLIRNYPFIWDYIKLSIFFIMALLHLSLFWFTPKRKANLYIFIFSLLSMFTSIFYVIAYQHVPLAAEKMFFLILIVGIYNASSLFFLIAIYSSFGRHRGIIFYTLIGTCFISLLVMIMIYYSGWYFSLIIYPMLTYLESARIAVLARRKNIIGAGVVSFGAISFLLLYPIANAFFFGLLQDVPSGILGHLTFNLGILSLPISLSIYLATEAGFTSRSLEMKLVEVKQLSEKAILQERENRQLQELDGIKSRFFANISHEFRTPLSIIRGVVEKLRKNNLPSSVEQDLDTINRNANRLLQMINQLLDLSKLEAGKLELQLKSGDLTNLLKLWANTFASLFESKNIAYHYTVPLQPAFVLFDEEKLELIINNILSNAAKFTPPKGEVSFTATVQKTDNQSCLLQMIVQDTGIGILSSQLPRIFERFYQSDNSITRQYEGTGIGLALVKEIVDLHGGQVKAESWEGKGSIFTVQIPLKLADIQEFELLNLPETMAEDKGEELKSDDKRKPKHQKHVLIVEDNAELRHFIHEYISESYDVIEAENGLEGFKKATETIPNLIISDIMMPGLDGISLCRKLKEDPRTSHIPIILLTAKTNDESKIEGLKTGADEYLIKPFSAEELLLRVNNLIRQQQKFKEKFSQSITLNPGEVSVASVDEQFLQRVLKVMDEHSANAEFDVVAFSREVGMSKAQLNRKLSALVDQSPGEFIRTFRLKKAANLLKQNHGNIAEIAFMVGFSSPNYFTKCFHDHYGVAPSEYMLSGSTTESPIS